MILVTVGTNEQPFDRLVAAAAALDPGEERLVVQHGASRVPHGAGDWLDFVSFDELARLMREARAVLCHAGVGSIMLARRSGKRPVVVPRRLALGEAVDDHQLPLARRLHDAGAVTLVEDVAQAGAALRTSAQATPGALAMGLPSVDALAGELRDFLAGQGAPAARRA